MTDFNSQSGFSLVSTMVATGIIGLSAYGIMNLSSSNHALMQNQKSMEMRGELFRALQNIHAQTDCGLTISDFLAKSGGTSLPNAPTPISLKRGDGKTILTERGQNKGRFTFAARLTSSDQIDLEFAAIKGKTANARKQLASTATKDFVKTSNLVWDKTTSERLASTYFPSLTNVCPGAFAMYQAAQTATTIASTSTSSGFSSTSQVSSSNAGSSGSGTGRWFATAQICGSDSRCQKNGLNRCRAAVGNECSKIDARCYNAKGFRVFKCVKT